MPKILLITDVLFWAKSAGHSARIDSLISFLSTKNDLTVVYVGTCEENINIEIENDYKITFYPLESKLILSPSEYCYLFSEFIKFKSFDFCIIEYIHNSYFLESIPESVITILDIHDIIYERSKSFIANNVYSFLFDIPRELEIELLQLYDYVIVLCEEDRIRLIDELINTEIIVCSYHISPVPKEIKQEARILGFVGSEYQANIDAMHFFLTYCWKHISSAIRLQFHIYGNVCKVFKPDIVDEDIKYIGFVNDKTGMYKEIDILVNPVRVGAGIKIKNVESLAHGVPLITTEHGSKGLSKISNKGFLVANSPKDFSEAVIKLAKDYELRVNFQKTGYRFISEEFGAHKCYSPLLKILRHL